MSRVRICVPITGQQKADIVYQAECIKETDAEVVEWRYDLWEQGKEGQSSPEEMLRLISETIGDKKLLFTIRTRQQGGAFTAPQQDYERICLAAVDSGLISYVDIEDSTEKAIIETLVSAAGKMKVRTIGSYHDFGGTPETGEIVEKLRSLAGLGVDIVKTAYMPKKPQDTARLLLATAMFREEDAGKHEMITMSMGEIGKISRIAGGVFGSDYTFASVVASSAPGQMPIREVRDLTALFSVDNREKVSSEKKENLYLEGFMACGKSTVAGILAKKLSRQCMEMDTMIEEEAGMTIPEIFERFGEDHFRILETGVLKKLSGCGQVISCGGGLPVREENRKYMAEGGKTVYLRVRPETVVSRLDRAQTGRPVLKGKVNIEDITVLMKKREPMYMAAADLILETDNMTPQEIADAIAEYIK